MDISVESRVWTTDNQKKFAIHFGSVTSFYSKFAFGFDLFSIHVKPHLKMWDITFGVRMQETEGDF